MFIFQHAFKKPPSKHKKLFEHKTFGRFIKEIRSTAKPTAVAKKVVAGPGQEAADSMAEAFATVHNLTVKNGHKISKVAASTQKLESRQAMLRSSLASIRGLQQEEQRRVAKTFVLQKEETTKATKKLRGEMEAGFARLRTAQRVACGAIALLPAFLWLVLWALAACVDCAEKKAGEKNRRHYAAAQRQAEREREKQWEAMRREMAAESDL